MFTPIKRALTVITITITITASLLTPISANAKQLTQEAGKEAMLSGRIISVGESGTNFVIEYRGGIIVCQVASPSKFVWLNCYDDQRE